VVFWVTHRMIAMKGQEIDELQIIYLFILIMQEINRIRSDRFIADLDGLSNKPCVRRLNEIDKVVTALWIT
jgi:hypothetical protein